MAWKVQAYVIAVPIINDKIKMYKFYQIKMYS